MMRLFRKMGPVWLAIAWLAATPSPQARAESQQSDTETIRELYQAAGMERLLDQLITTITSQVFDSLLASRTDIPEAARTRFKQQMVSGFSESKGAFLEAMIPVYQRHFTGAEMRQMIAFYKSDLGQKLIEKMPILMHEGAKVGQQWGRAVARRVVEEMRAKAREEGYDL